MSENKVKWHRCADEKPSKNGLYIVTYKDKNNIFVTDWYWFTRCDSSEKMWNRYVVAWAEMPEPYKEEE